MTNKRILGVVLVGAILAAMPAAALAKPIKLELKLPQKPAFPKPELSASLTAGPITVEVTDARGAGDPAVVGAQRAKGEDVYLWRTDQPVGPTVRNLVAQVLSGWSVPVAPEADFALKLALTSFYVKEKSEMFGSTYIADVHFHVSFVDRAGNVVWTGEAAGTEKQQGPDERAAICNEVLSGALRQALAQALPSIKPEAKAPAVHDPAPVPAVAVVPAPAPIEPAVLFADLMRLKSGGVSDDVLVAYVEQKKLARPLSVDEILQWKNAGLPDAAIKVATRP